MSFTRQQFDQDMELLRNKLLQMGFATEEMVRDAVAALVTQDMPLAQTIIPRDDAVDQMEREIEAQCLLLLARQQPIASDLRLIGSALKVITDIERIGDHAVDIARVAQRVHGETLYRPLVDVPRLGDLARAMLHDSLEAFVRRDLALVVKVIADDEAVNACYAQMRTDLQRLMQEEPTSVVQASYLLFVAHYLERISDHCKNIVERVAFIETGRVLQPHGPDAANVRLTAAA